MKKLEAKLSSRFRLWGKKELHSCAWETKHTRGKSFFNCSELKEHQYWSLLAVASKSGLSYKISDDSIGYKPFDGFIMKNMPAYIVIQYNKGIVGISIKDWNLKWKRLSYEEAVSVSSFTIKI